MKIFQSPASQNEPRTSRPPACGSKHECSTPRRTCACRRVSGKTFCTLEIPWKFERQKVKGSKLAGLQALHYLKPPKLMWTARNGWMTTASRHAERLKQLSACLQHFASSFSSITVWISKTQSKKMSLSNCWFVKLKTNATCKLCSLYMLTFTHLYSLAVGEMSFDPHRCSWQPWLWNLSPDPGTHWNCRLKLQPGCYQVVVDCSTIQSCVYWGGRRLWFKLV